MSDISVMSNENLGTKEAFLELSKICEDNDAMMETKFYGDSGMHLVAIKCGTKRDKKEGSGFQFKQSGDSLNYCVNSVLSRTKEFLNLI